MSWPLGIALFLALDLLFGVIVGKCIAYGMGSDE